MSDGSLSEVDDSEIFLIPIAGRPEEAVEVKLSELSDDPTRLIDILKAEIAPLDLWLKFAVAYYRNGKYNAFCTILEDAEVDDPEIENHYPNSKKERIAILDTLAAYHINQGLYMIRSLRRV